MHQKFKQDLPIGQNLKTLRKKVGLTQAQVAAKLQVAGGTIGDVTTLAKIEAGVRNIRVSDLMALQSIFACDYSEFFRGL